ncbi:MAG: tetratricopeptide repeat protein [Candidatus Omnitrophica bacterium]|nr:tetratricopeptide repeat protein [Candidatus Omnitrophota bacterium]
MAEDYHRMAYDAQQSEDYSRALSYYFKALSINPKNGSYWNDIGLVYEAMGDLDNAEKSYLHALRMDPKFLAPYANLGVVYNKKQNPVKAVYYLKKRIELGDPADPWTQKARLELQDIYMATPLYRERFLQAETKRLNLEASQKTRDNFQNQIKVANSEYERGMTLLKEQKSKEAVKAFNDSLAFAPGNPKVVQARAEAQKLDRSQQVEKTVQQAMVYLKAGKEQAAKKKFNEVLAIIPNQPN